jgi:alpha-tubulin suppressor-like RCC1 family protein
MLDGTLLLYSVCDGDVAVSIERYCPESRVLRTYSGGGDMIIVLLEDGSIMVRGSNAFNQLHVTSYDLKTKQGLYINTWTRGFADYSAARIKSFSIGRSSVLVLDKSGSAQGFGSNDDGQLSMFKDGPVASAQKIQCIFLYFSLKQN